MDSARLYAFSSARILLVFVVVLVFANSTHAGNEIKFSHNGHWYESLGQHVCHTWIEARDFSLTQTFQDPDTGILLQGHLVTIQDIDEDIFVHNNFVGNAWEQIWIGAFQFSHDDGLADNWAWVTGEEWDYSNWDLERDQPDSFEEDYARKLNFRGLKWHDFPNEASPCGYLYTVVEYEPPIYSCSGFKAPMDKTVMVKKKNRVLPLKMLLFDQSGAEVTNLEFSPLVEVSFTGGSPTEPPEQEFLASGKGDEGNQFSYISNYYQFNLQTKNFSGSGMYTIRAVSGSSDTYTLAPTCEATFVIQ